MKSCHLTSKGHEYSARLGSALQSLPSAQRYWSAMACCGYRSSGGATLDIGHSVQFLGIRRDVPALLAIADVYVHPSLQEGYSNSLMEAMAAGCAVVATAVGGNVEAVDDGVTGLLVPPRDDRALCGAISRLLSNPHEARAMASGRATSVRARSRHRRDGTLVRRVCMIV